MTRTALTLAFSIASTAIAQTQPPAGAVVDTGRFGPRTEINAVNTPGDADSTFKITRPGSYYLAADVIVEAGFTGIEIAASDVSIDLNGFAIRGFFGSGENGIAPDANSRTDTFNGLRVVNGHIRQMQRGFRGRINAVPSGLVFIENVILDNITIDADVEGILFESGVVRDCTVYSRDDGINMVGGQVVNTHVLIAGGGNEIGIGLNEAAAINCTVEAEDRGSTTGIAAVNGSVTGCTVIGVSIGFAGTSSLFNGCFASAPQRGSFTLDCLVWDSNFSGPNPP
ncbi:MAG: hypothetical protein AAFR38_05405 [Planctomycetota bacterium]